MAITFQLQRTQIHGQVVTFEQVPEPVTTGDGGVLPPPVLVPKATITLDQLQTIMDDAELDELPAILEFSVDVPT